MLLVGVVKDASLGSYRCTRLSHSTSLVHHHYSLGCFIAGSFGVVALCAHTIAYNLIPLLFMIPLGICTGLTVRIGNVIVYDPDRAKLLAYWTFFLTAGIGAVVSFALHFFQLPIIHLFTHDEQVVHLTQAIWAKNCYYVFILYIFGINGAILRGKLSDESVVCALSTPPFLLSYSTLHCAFRYRF